MQKAFHKPQDKHSCWLGCSDAMSGLHKLTSKNLFDLFSLCFNIFV